MRFALWPGLETSWEDLLTLARQAETTGWDGVWWADHFMPGSGDVGRATGECWAAVAALAALVPRIRIGPLVGGNTYRHPAVLAKMAAGVDIISGGRLVLGLGAGWQENEHVAYGIPFSTTADRLRRLDEACQVITSLFRDERTTFEGRYYQLQEAPLAPKPVQHPLPLMIGGMGEKRTLKIVAKYAQEWNGYGQPPMLQHKMAVLDQHCASVGRDPGEIQRSCPLLVVNIDDWQKMDYVSALSDPVEVGDRDAVLRGVQQYAAIGINEIIVKASPLGHTVAEMQEAMDRFITTVQGEFG